MLHLEVDQVEEYIANELFFAGAFSFIFGKESERSCQNSIAAIISTRDPRLMKIRSNYAFV